jgi:hypothetical protein
LGLEDVVPVHELRPSTGIDAFQMRRPADAVARVVLIGTAVAIANQAVLVVAGAAP